MRLFITVLIACMFSVGLQAKLYIYIEKGIKLPLKKQDVTLYSGTPVEKIASKGDVVKVRLSGFVGKKDKTKLFATKNLKLLLAVAKKPGLIKIKDDKGILEVNVPKKSLTDDMEEAWATGSDLFYDKCTKCHHAKIVEHHSMQNWDALFGSMKYKAKTTKIQNEEILRFLRAFAKDGILKESD